jgi:hypothetical protein
MKSAYVKTWLTRGVFAAVFAWLAYLSLAQSPGSLSVDIRDANSGVALPAMVCITSATDHQWRVPPDGSIVPPYTRVPDFYQPKPWKPGQIGWVRLTTGLPQDNQARVPIYNHETSYPYWKEPVSYFVTQPFTIALPPGMWRVAVARGIEYEPSYEELEIAAGQTLTRAIQLRRWVNMPQRGWYSGDTHVHFPRMTDEQSEFILTWARAEDVHVSSILSFGDLKGTYFDQVGYGRNFRYQKGDYLLASGQEDPRTGIPEQGHTIALNITRTVRDVARYHLYDHMFDEAHKQPGALTGYAHIAWADEFHRRQDPTRHPTWDPIINAIRGKVDFFEIMQFRHLGLDEYYDFLNLGVRVTATAGSDMPWASTIGEVRTYAYTGPDFSADRWYAAVKDGHTFVTNGPMLEFTVGDVLPGDDIKLSGPGKLRVHARGWAPESIGAPKVVEVVVNGKVVRSDTSTLDFDLDVPRSLWVAARVTSTNGAAAHTSPVYVMVGGRTPRSDDAPSIAERRMKELDFIESRLQDPKYVAEYGPGEVEALRERIMQARRIYETLKGGV